MDLSVQSIITLFLERTLGVWEYKRLIPANRWSFCFGKNNDLVGN